MIMSIEFLKRLIFMLKLRQKFSKSREIKRKSTFNHLSLLSLNSNENNATDIFNAIVMGIVGVLVQFAKW